MQKMRRGLVTAASLIFLSLLAGCAGGNGDAKPDSISIPTPSGKPVEYLGEVKTDMDLLMDIQAADPESGWVQDTSGEGFSAATSSFKSKDFCYLYTFPSFQEAVNNDSGAYGDSWTLLGRYFQLGLIMVDRADCATKLNQVISFPAQPYGGSELEVLKPSKEKINDCLVRHASCLLDEGVQFPSESTSFYKRPLKELYLLAEAGFCQVPLEHAIDTVNPGGLDSCELASDKGGSGYETLISQETRDSSILRIAARTPMDLGQDSYGKYLIYGDGWAIYMYESTEKQKQLFIDMQKVVKGTLVARY